MRQQDFDFVVKDPATPQTPLDPRIVADVVELMAAAIVVACKEGAENGDCESARERQDHD